MYLFSFASSGSCEMVWNISSKFWWECPVLVNFVSRCFVVCKLCFLFIKNLIFIFSVVFLVQWESDFNIQCTILLPKYHLLKLLNCRWYKLKRNIEINMDKDTYRNYVQKLKCGSLVACMELLQPCSSLCTLNSL
jgi:hypothetical protein